jgi:hypothetical protein
MQQGNHAAPAGADREPGLVVVELMAKQPLD